MHAEPRDMVEKRYPPSEYGANYPDLGIASELRPSSLGHVFTTNALGTKKKLAGRHVSPRRAVTSPR